MLKTHCIGLYILTLIACTQSAQNKELEIQEKERTLLSDTLNFRIDRAKAEELIILYDDYVNKNPQHERAADYLFKAGKAYT